MKNETTWAVRITLNSIFVAIISFPLVFGFLILSYKLITQAFIDPEVRDNIESYLAVLGILSGPSYMVISRFFDRWNIEQDEYIESQRLNHKTADDINRRKLN